MLGGNLVLGIFKLLVSIAIHKFTYKFNIVQYALLYTKSGGSISVIV